MKRINQNGDNEFRVWKEKVDNLTEFPLKDYDPDAAWERLRIKMATREAAMIQPESKKKSRVIYWYSAAATALLILSLFFFTNKPKDPELIGNNPKVEQPNINNTSPQNITKDPVINVEQVTGPNPSENLAQQTFPRTYKDTKDTRYQVDPLVTPPNVPKEPLPVILARIVEPRRVIHANNSPFIRNKKPVNLPLHEGGRAPDMGKVIGDQSGFALFINP